jgi:hypothetical protein
MMDRLAAARELVMSDPDTLGVALVIRGTRRCYLRFSWTS